MGPTREGSVFCLSTGPQGAHGSVTEACEVEGGARGREKVNSGHWQKRPDDAGGNFDASTDLDPLALAVLGVANAMKPMLASADTSSPVMVAAAPDGRRGWYRLERQ